MRNSIITILAAIAVLFLGGLFIFVAWNAIAHACNLPEFSYWVCVCFVGALGVICNQLGGLFKHSSKKDEDND